MCLAVPGKIVRLTSLEPPVAEVDFGGVSKPVSLDFVPAAKPGEHVLVHVGVALQVIDESEAAELRGYLRQLGEPPDGAEGPSEDEAGSAPPATAAPPPPTPSSGGAR